MAITTTGTAIITVGMATPTAAIAVTTALTTIFGIERQFGNEGLVD
jgi:hypothetical protein